MKYDYILFENAYQLENHYYDLELLAHALRRAGFSVAIADVFKEERLCSNNDLPHINLRIKPYRFFRELSAYRKNVSSFRYSVLRFLCSIYLVYTLYALKNKTKNFYIGSLTIDTPILWLLLLPRRRNYLIWGLRSHIINKWKEKLFERYGLYSFLLNVILIYTKRIKLIVSNEIIKEEFSNIIKDPHNRIIVRPERWVSYSYRIKISKSKNDKCVFLTIGTLRKNKHVEIVLDAIRQIKALRIEYIIAGRCKDNNGYNEMIKARMEGLDNVRRIDRFIPVDEYQRLFEEADYVILCDEPEKSCGTNGTFLEALLKGCPVIAPMHEPFISDINSNEVGLLYDLNDTKSLVSCIEKAVCNGPSFYEKNIKHFLDNLREDKVVELLKKQLNGKNN